MSDLYGTDDRSSFDPESEPGNEPEDMSIFLHNLLQNTPATVGVAGGSSVGQSVTLEYRGSGCASIINSSSAAASLNFSDPGGFFPSEAKERVDKAFSSAGGGGECEAVTSSFVKRGEFSNATKGSEGSEGAANQNLPRYSKRSRSAEVHNLSEKRRRSRINEKLKALQNLIPNSNKTDKASMLDEAIEYLKQLQLQVQMLTMRNGFSLHPNYVPGCLPSMQLPMDFDEGNVLPNTSRGADALAGNQEVVMQTVFGTDNPKVSSHQVVVPSGTPFGLESSFQTHYELLNHLASAKDICRDDTLPQFPLDISCSGNNSSSGVSS